VSETEIPAFTSYTGIFINTRDSKLNYPSISRVLAGRDPVHLKIGPS